MLLQKKEISIPIHDFLNSECASIDADFSLIYKNQDFHFNSTYLISISQTIRDIFISDPLAFEYTINAQFKNKIKDIIGILSNPTFKISGSNYDDCFNLSFDLRSDQLFSFIWERICSKLKSREILKYSVLAYKNRIELPESLEIRLAEEFQKLFFSGLIIEMSFDECYAISLTECNPKEDKEFLDRHAKSEKPQKAPVYTGIDQSIGPTPPGIIYLMLKKYPTYLLSFVRNILVNRCTNTPDNKPKNSFLKSFDPDAQQDGKNLLNILQTSNINTIRFFYNSIKLKNNFTLDSSLNSLCPFTVPSKRKFDYYNNYNGIMKTQIRPIIKAPLSISPKYPIMNILIYDDTRKYSDQKDIYYLSNSYVSREEKNNFIEFDFSPHYIKLTSFIMINPPKSWKLTALYPKKPDEPTSWFLIDKHISNSNTENENLVFRDVKNLEVSCQKFKLQQPEDTSFQFSLSFIDFFGTVEKGSTD